MVLLQPREEVCVNPTDYGEAHRSSYAVGGLLSWL